MKAGVPATLFKTKTQLYLCDFNNIFLWNVFTFTVNMALWVCYHGDILTENESFLSSVS